MDLRHLNELSDWSDDYDYFREIDEADSYMTRKQDPACAEHKSAYTQWQQVVFLLHSALSTIEENPEAKVKSRSCLVESLSSSMMSEALIVAIKLKCCERNTFFVHNMENAAIIRRSAGTIYSQLLLLNDENSVEKSYIEVVRSEINTFRELFKAWVATFQRDEFEDEWGLFS